MVEQIPDMPPGTLGFSATGDVTRSDYVEVLLPALNRTIADGGRLRVLFRIGPELEHFHPGALWEELKADLDLGIRHHEAWERLAIVTDVGWARRAVTMFGWLAPGEARLFALAEDGDARAWVGGARS